MSEIYQFLTEIIGKPSWICFLLMFREVEIMDYRPTTMPEPLSGCQESRHSQRCSQPASMRSQISSSQSMELPTISSFSSVSSVRNQYKMAYWASQELRLWGKLSEILETAIGYGMKRFSLNPSLMKSKIPNQGIFSPGTLKLQTCPPIFLSFIDSQPNNYYCDTI